MATINRAYEIGAQVARHRYAYREGRAVTLRRLFLAKYGSKVSAQDEYAKGYKAQYAALESARS